MNFKYSLHCLKPPFDILGEESFVGAVLARAHLSHNSKFHRPKDHLTHSLPYNVLQRSDPSKHSVQRKTIDHGMRSSMLPSVVLSFCWHPALCIVNCLQLAELALCLSCLVLSCLATLHLSPLANRASLLYLYLSLFLRNFLGHPEIVYVMQMSQREYFLPE